MLIKLLAIYLDNELKVPSYPLNCLSSSI